jgi:hypothetical protein
MGKEPALGSSGTKTNRRLQTLDVLGSYGVLLEYNKNVFYFPTNNP